MKANEQSISFMMKMITDRVSSLFAPRMASLLTAPQCRVLMYMEACGGGPVSQRDLGRYLGVSHTTVKGLLQRLEEKGFVRTAHDDTDARVKNAYLTEKSAQMKNDMEQSIRDMHAQLLQGISEEEQALVSRVLHKMYANIAR
ncbi:MAG: MarR family transcriptional regulator [Akkermansia sp.]|nr:MarR family transcriptional regulator [Akkermansia sp.]